MPEFYLPANIRYN